jgi:uncharacterized membrane protein HdeD (DUF308 family)
MWILKLLLMGVFTLIFVQDYKDRKVYRFLYPLMGALVFVLQWYTVSHETIIMNVGVNLLFVGFLLLTCYLYAKLKLRQPLLKAVLGPGDVMFFVFIAFSFSMLSFIILFVFSLIFSLLLHLVFQHKQTEKTVPLAGYMSLFFGVVYGISFFSENNFLYAY